MLDYQRDGGAVTPNPQVMAILIGRMVMKQMERGTLRIRQTHLANDRWKWLNFLPEMGQVTSHLKILSSSVSEISHG